MLDKDIQPNTIGGIKRYAKQIKKEYEERAWRQCVYGNTEQKS